MFLEWLFHFLEVGQDAHVVRKLHGALGDAGEGGQHIVVHLAGIGLPRDGHHPFKAKVFGDAPFHGQGLGAVAVEQLEEAGLGAGGALGAQQGQGADAVFQLLVVHAQLVQPQAGALAHGGQLGGLQMGVGKAGQGLVLLGEGRQLVHHVQQLFAHQLQRVAHHQHVGVVAHIAAGGPQVDDAPGVGTLQAVGVHVAHHVVAALFLPALGVLVIDVVPVGLQLGDLLVGDGQALGLLGPGQGDPQPAPGAELVLFGEQVLHFPACIPGAEGALIGIVRHGFPP